MGWAGLGLTAVGRLVSVDCGQMFLEGMDHWPVSKLLSFFAAFSHQMALYGAAGMEAKRQTRQATIVTLDGREA